MGGILDVRWAHNGIVTTGHYCTAQGTIQQIGELGVALVTLVCLLPRCFQVCNSLMRTSPASRRQQLVGGSVGTRPGSAWRCFWPGLSYLCFHCALGWHRRRPSQELRSAHTSALFNLVLSCPCLPPTQLGSVLVLDQHSLLGRTLRR